MCRFIRDEPATARLTVASRAIVATRLASISINGSNSVSAGVGKKIGST